MTVLQIVLLIVAFIFACVTTLNGASFIAVYGFTAKWWKSEYGWHLMCFTLAVTLAFGFTIANALGWTRSFGLTINLIIEVVVFGLCAFVTGWRNVILWRVQIRKRRKLIKNAHAQG